MTGTPAAPAPKLDLFLPVDTTVPGVGAGPLGCAETYTQNRASLHLHGGLTPWISGGTPDQWVTPAAEDTPYRSGESLVNVPDMPDPGPGATTMYSPTTRAPVFSTCTTTPSA